MSMLEQNVIMLLYTICQYDKKYKEKKIYLWNLDILKLFSSQQWMKDSP